MAGACTKFLEYEISGECELLPMDTTIKPDAQPRDSHLFDPDKHDAWVLRAGAELWKAVVAEANHPAEDTRLALQAVRAALNAARRLRFAGDVPPSERLALTRLAARAEAAQTQALRRWGQGRGLDWGDDWGERWGEALVEETGSDTDNGEPDLPLKIPA